MFNKRLVTILLLGILALAACAQPATPAPEDTAPPQATSSPEATASPEAPSSALTAGLTELVGKVDLKNPGQDSFAGANAEAILQVDGQIQTGDDGRVRLDLSSGTIVRVAPSSLFTLTSNEQVEGGLATKIKLELGKIFIILNGGNAEVETSSGVASVRGSYIGVELTNSMLTLTCLEGNCGFSNGAGELHFTNGQKISIPLPLTPPLSLPEIGQMTLEDFQDWLSNPEAKQLVDQAIAGGNACMGLIQPGGGSTLPFQGKVKFEWESLPGAHSYVLTFKTAGGNTITFPTTETSLEKYIEIMPGAGEYSWEVTALGEDGSELCTTEPAAFSKPDSKWVPPPNDEEPEPEQPMCDPEMYTCGGQGG